MDIDTYDFDKECIHLTTNGQYAGTFMYIPDECYSMNGDAARITIKEEYKDVINLKYILCSFQNLRRKNGFTWTKKPRKDDIMDVYIKIPIKDDGNYDMDAQRAIAQQYIYLEKFKNEIRNRLEALTRCVVDLS